MSKFPNQYSAPQKYTWSGRIDSTDDRRQFRWHQVIQQVDLNEDGVSISGNTVFCFLGFACDEGVRRNQGRPGAEDGPKAIKKALASLPVHFSDQVSLVDAGTVRCDDGNLELAQQCLTLVVQDICERGWIPIVLGGGHEVALGHGRALFEQSQDKGCSFGIVNIDAHYDLRPLDDEGRGSSGTPFLQLAEFIQAQESRFNYLCLGIQKLSNTPSLFDKAKELEVTTVMRESMRVTQLDRTQAIVETFAKPLGAIYLTICLDAFSAQVAPGVSAPSPLGLIPQEILPILKNLIKTGKVIGFDVAEMAPIFDVDSHTAKLAAQLIFEFVDVWEN